MNRAVLLILLTLLPGCETYELDQEWSPLTTLIERPALPGVGAGVVTTKGSHVYTQSIEQFLIDYPPGSVESNALLSHEREHARRQFAYKGLAGELALAAWISRYITDPSFMFAEEQHGYYQAITQLQAAGRWNARRTASVARAMANSYRTILGEPMTTEADAKAWVEAVLRMEWKPE